MSRKKQVNQKITALYCRISLEDGGDNESMSISNQKLMLRDFAEKNGMFRSISFWLLMLMLSLSPPSSREIRQ